MATTYPGTLDGAPTTHQDVQDGLAAVQSTLGTNPQGGSTTVGARVAAVETGKAATSHTHGVTDLTATGTRDATTYLRGDNTWATPSGGGGGSSLHEAVQPSDGTNVGLVLPGFPLLHQAGTFTLNGNWTYYIPMILHVGRTLDTLTIDVSTAQAGSVAVSVHGANANMQPTSLLVDGGALDVSTTGAKTTAALATTIPAGYYLIRVQSSISSVSLMCSTFSGFFRAPGHGTANRYIQAFANSTTTYSATAPTPGAAVTSFIYGTNGGYALALPKFALI